MAVLIANGIKEAPIAQIEYGMQGTGASASDSVIVYCHEGQSTDAVDQALQEAGYEVSYQHALFNGQQLLVAEGGKGPEALLSVFRDKHLFNDEAHDASLKKGPIARLFAPITNWFAKQDLLNWRGYLGLAGQAGHIMSGELMTGNLKHRDSAVQSFISNLFPAIWGVQRSVSESRTELYRQGIDDFLRNEGLGIPKTESDDPDDKDAPAEIVRMGKDALDLTEESVETLVDKAPLRKKEAAEPEPKKGILGQINGFIQAWSLRISDFIKIYGKVLLTQAGTAKKPLKKYIGQMSLAGKFITMAGKSEDPVSYEEMIEKEEHLRSLSPWQRAARKLNPMNIWHSIQEHGDVIDGLRYSATTITGYLEIVANSLLIPDAFRAQKFKRVMIDQDGNPVEDEAQAAKNIFGKPKLKSIPDPGAEVIPFDPFQFSGASLILGGMVMKALAPFSIKFPDQEEVFAHTAEMIAEYGGSEEERARFVQKAAVFLTSKPGFEYKIDDKDFTLTTAYIMERLNAYLDGTAQRVVYVNTQEPAVPEQAASAADPLANLSHVKLIPYTAEQPIPPATNSSGTTELHLNGVHARQQLAEKGVLA